jgi:hypothetical protein
MDPFALLPPVIQKYATIADQVTPELHVTEQRPLEMVTAERDDTAIMGWKAVSAGKVEEMKVLVAGDQVILDFGES